MLPPLLIYFYPNQKLTTMKNKFQLSTLIVALILITHISFGAILNTEIDKSFTTVEKIDSIPHFYKSNNLFFSRQPNLQTLELVKNEGVDVVINLRSDEEMEDFAKTSFCEKSVVKKLGMDYISIPIEGPVSYTPENLEKLAKALDQPSKKFLIHCASCGRVSHFVVAYLIKYKNYSFQEATDFGKQLRYYYPVEMILGEDVKMSL